MKKKLKGKANEFINKVKAIESCNQKRLKKFKYNDEITNYDINTY